MEDRLITLIPRSRKRGNPDISNVVRDVFQSSKPKFPLNVGENLIKSNSDNVVLKESGIRVMKTFNETKLSRDDIGILEKGMMLRQGIFLNEKDMIENDPLIKEMVRLKRRDVFHNLQDAEIEKYGLLEKNDLLPSKPERSMDFRINSNPHLCAKCPSDLSLVPVKEEKQKLFSSKSNAGKVLQIQESNSQQNVVSKLSKQPNFNDFKSKPVSLPKPPAIFRAEPGEIVFWDYMIDVTYEKTFKLRNISKTRQTFVPRRLPKSRYFRVELHPESTCSGLAPGMCAIFKVYFRADIYEDSREQAVFGSYNGSETRVLLVNCREPPKLVMFIFKSPEHFSNKCSEINSDNFDARRSIAVNSTIDCGSCLLGDGIRYELLVKNCGSVGNFFLIGEEDWYHSQVNTVDSNLTLTLGSFKISPVYFKMDKDDFLAIELIFHPLVFGLEVQKMFLLCDNGTLEGIELVGDGVLFEMTSIVVDTAKDSQVQPKQLVSQSYDDEAEYVIYFGHCVPFVKVYRAFTIYNNSLVDIHLKWEMRDCNCTTTNSLKYIKKLDADFIRISHTSHVLPTCSTTTFEICLDLQTTEVGTYGLVLVLYVSDIPEMSLDEDRVFYVLGNDEDKDISTESNYLDVIIAEVEIIATVIPFTMTFYPKSFVYIEDFKNFHVVCQKITISTNCLSTLECKWMLPKSEHVYLYPSVFWVDSNHPTYCYVIVHVASSESIKEKLRLSINNGTHQKEFPINIIMAKHMAKFSQRYINFGMLRRSCSPQLKYLTIMNAGQYNLQWQIIEYFYNPFNNSFEQFNTTEHLTSNSGTLRKGRVFTIGYKISRTTLRKYPRWCSYLILFSRDPSSTTALDLCLVTYYLGHPKIDVHINLSDYPIISLPKALYIRAPVQVKLCLYNTSSQMAASYIFGFPVGQSNSKAALFYEQRVGIIKPKECAHVSIIVVPLLEGPIDNFFIPCFIGSTSKPHLLKMEGTVKDIKARFYLPCNDCSKNYYVIYWPPNSSSISNSADILAEKDIVEDNDIMVNLDEYSTDDSSYPSSSTSNCDNSDNGRSDETNYLSMPFCPCGIDEGEEVAPRETRQECCTVKPPLESYRKLFDADTVFQTNVIEMRQVPIRTAVKKAFFVRNATTVPVRYWIEVINFPSCGSEIELTPLQKVIAKPVNIWEEGIKDDLGLVVKAIPDCGSLRGSETILFELWIYANTWGMYLEEIVINLDGLLPFCFNLLVEVVGTCIEYPIAVNSITNFPNVHFGDMPYLSKPIMRKLKIKNTAKIPINLIFEIFTSHRSQCLCSTRENQMDPVDFEMATMGYKRSEDEDVFQVRPCELTISGNETKCLQITMFPNNFKVDFKATQISAFLIGRIDVEDFYAYRPNVFVRRFNLNSTVTKVKLDASLELPLLKLELIKGDTRMKAYANDILEDNKVCFRKVLVFKNFGKAPATVYMHITEPFRIVTLRTVRADRKETITSAAVIPPNECVEVLIECVIYDEEVLQFSDALYNDKAKIYQEIPNFTHQSITVERSLNIHQEGIEKQVVALELIIYYPILKISTDFIDFGVVFIGNTKKMFLTLTNPTGSHIPFTVIKPSTAKYLTVVPSKGIVPKGTASTPTSLILSLFFVPRECLSYQDSIRIYTNIPFYNFTVTVLGTGSKNEKFNNEGT